MLAFEIVQTHNINKHAETLPLLPIVYSSPNNVITNSNKFSLEVLTEFPELARLLKGNQDFSKDSEVENPGLIRNLSEGQHPKVCIFFLTLWGRWLILVGGYSLFILDVLIVEFLRLSFLRLISETFL